MKAFVLGEEMVALKELKMIDTKLIVVSVRQIRELSMKIGIRNLRSFNVMSVSSIVWRAVEICV